MEEALGDIASGVKLVKPTVLFSKIESEEPPWKKQDSDKVESKEEKEMSTEGDDLVTIEEFGRLDIRIGTVLEVNDHPKADKLVLIKVDMGTEERRLVAGLKGHYSADELVGKQIAVIVNLKPAKLRGELSEGMLLAAVEDPSKVKVLVPDTEVKNGSKVS